MKNYGKVSEYNGVYGNIDGIDGKKYMLLDKNTTEEIKVSDNVEFEPENSKTEEIEEINIARFVRVLKKKNNKIAIKK